jgi:hypothetical protein
MHDKSLTALLYVLSGILLGLAPLLPRLFPDLRKTLAEPWEDYLGYGLAGLAIIVIGDGSVSIGVLLVIAAIAAASVRLQGDWDWLSGLGMGVGLVISCSLIWWRRTPVSALHLDSYESTGFIVLGAVTLWGLRTLGKEPLDATADSDADPERAPLWPYLAYLAVSALLCFDTFALETQVGTGNAWHHWGAYIGPAELLLKGAHLFSDFPAQYGLGPTLLIAGACGHDCWTGLYFLVGASNLLNVALLGWMVRLLLGQRRSMLAECTALGLMLVCALLWTSLPSAVMSPLIYPSVGGLRFLPVVALAALCVHASVRGRPLPRAGHALWALGVLWSPESAFYCSFVWWPLALSFAAQQIADERQALARSLLRTVGVLAVSLVLLILAFLGAYTLTYGELPTRVGLLAYALYPPGPLPVAAHGAVLFALAVLLMAGAVLVVQWRDERNRERRMAHFTVLLLAYGGFSYFVLGRSHDNNLLNLSPLFLLLALSLLRCSPRPEWRHASLGLISGYACWLVSFGWGVWGSALEQGTLTHFGPQAALARFSYADPQTSAYARQQFSTMLGDPADLQRAIEMINALHSGPSDLITVSMTLPRGTPDQAWNALHGPENFAYLPASIRQDFLRRTAQRLKLCGWVVVDASYPDGYQGYPSKVQWLTDYDAVYDMDRQLQLGPFHAFHLRPKGMAQCPAT